jgi:hypothetical protein
MRTVSIPASFSGKHARLVVEAADLGTDNLLEVAVDDVSVFKQ